MKKAIIFDLDGTLLNTLPDITDHINLAFKEYGLREMSIAEVRQFVSLPVEDLIEQASGYKQGTSEYKEVFDKYIEYAEDINCYHHLGFFDGIADVLVKLKERGYLLFILTNKSAEETSGIKNLFLKDYPFDEIVTQMPGVPTKPDPTSTINLLKKHGISPEKAYFVGDGETDVTAGLKAGTNVIAVLWGNRDKDFLAKYGASVFADKTSDLLNLIP